MWLIIFIVGFLPIQSPPLTPNNHLLDNSKSQANHYINHIEEKIDTDYNLWALTLLGSGNNKIQQYIERTIRQGNYQNNSLLLFKTYESNYRLQLKEVVLQTGSYDLLIDLLLKTEKKDSKSSLYKLFKSKFGPLKISDGINYPALCRSIINSKKITSDILPNNHFELPHLFFLYDGNRSTYITKQYIRDLIRQWIFTHPNDYSLPYILSKITLFRAYYLTDEYDQTPAVYDLLINNKLFPNSSLKLQIYRNLDYAMYRLGYYDRNLTIARRFTLPLAKYLNQENLELEIKFAMGINLYSIGKMKEAKEMYEQIRTQSSLNENNINQTSLYNNLGITYLKLGNFNKYLDLQFQALTKAKRDNNFNHELEILNNLFVIYRESNDLQSALGYLEKSQRIAENINNPIELGKVNILLGSFYKDFKADKKSALKYFTIAERLLDPENNARYFIYLLNDEAEIYEKDTKFKKALSKYKRVYNLTSKKNNVAHIISIINQASVYLKMGDNDKVKQLVKSFKKYDLSVLDFAPIVKAKTVEAEYLNKLDQPNRALHLLKPALDQVVERAHNSADLESGFWHVEDEYLDAFELAVTILNNNGKAGKAIEQLDRLKTINDASLYQSPLVRSRQLNETQLTQYNRLTAQLDATRKELLLAPQSRQFDIQQTINKLKLKKRQLDKKVTGQSGSKRITVHEIQNRLSAHDLVIHTTELNQKLYIAYITRSKISLKEKPFNEKKVQLFSKAAEGIATNKTNLDSLYAITQFLGLQNIPDRIDNITIIPDNYLYQLPVDVLPLTKPAHRYSYGQVSYWIEKYTTSYLTSLSDFIPDKTQQSDAQSQYKWDFAGYGISNFSGSGSKSLVPLPYATEEVTNISQDLTNFSAKKTFINRAATKEVFRQTAPKARVLHLATHSEVSERDPLFSSIYMSEEAQNADSSFQDQIFAYELFELNLNCDMIMLNSCESGSGSYIQGTGIKGISRSLRYAGAHSLVLNLWSVNDMLASEFAVHFYKLLNDGESKAEALQSTKRYFLKTKNASPHYWGPYLLIGNIQPLVRPNRTMNIAMAGLFLFYFLLLTGLSYLKDQGIIFKKKHPRTF